MFRTVFVALLFAAPTFADTPKFQPVELRPHIYDGGWEHFVGGGVAVFDCNDDGLPEVFAAGGKNPATLFRNFSRKDEKVTLQAETPDSLRIRGMIGAYPINIDNDGFTDLIVLRVGTNLMLKGGPNCSFSSFDDLKLRQNDAWSTAFSATWEAGQSLPTLAFGNYVDRENPDGPFEACDENFLYRPDSGAYRGPISLSPSYCPLSMLFSDWSRTGRADLRVSNDRHYYVTGGQEQLWQMSEKPSLFGPKDGWNEHRLWGMGISSRDISGDGFPEVMMTSMGDQRLQSRNLNRRGPSFQDMPFELGATAHRPYVGGDGRPSTGWHVEFGDVQNDGRDDIFIAKGNVEQMPGLAMKDPNNLLVQKSDGTFEEKGDVAGLASLLRGRGAAVVDLNEDGMLDIVVVNRRAPMEVFQNVTQNENNWVALRLHQAVTNRDAIGAWIEVDTGERVISREVTIGGGHAGGKLGFEHFGLADASSVRARVIWPDQRTSDWVHINAGRTYRLIRDGKRLRLND